MIYCLFYTCLYPYLISNDPGFFECCHFYKRFHTANIRVIY